MERRAVLRGLAAILTWAPLGVLLSAAECETAEEEESRLRQEELNSRMMLAMQQHWNAERQKQLDLQAKQQHVQLQQYQTPDHTTRNQNPIQLQLQVQFKF
jgi:hypothetical protein